MKDTKFMTNIYKVNNTSWMKGDDKEKIFLQRFFVWCVVAIIAMLTIGFLCVFGKYIYFLMLYNEYVLKTENILSNILDWTMKIVIGWLAKSFFEKK